GPGVEAPRAGPDCSMTADWVRKFFVAPGQAVELRVLYKDKRVDAGFFDADHVQAMVEHGLRLSLSGEVKGIYVSLNPLYPDVLSRPGLANRVRRARPGDAARTADVAGR